MVQAGPARLFLRRGQGRGVGGRGRRGGKVKGEPGLLERGPAQGELQGRGLPGVEQALGPELPGLGGDPHAALAQPQPGGAVRAGGAGGDLCQLPHIEQAEGHPGPGQRPALGVADSDGDRDHRGVVLGDALVHHAAPLVRVQGVGPGEQELCLLPGAGGEAAGVDEHGPGRRPGEPAPVQLGLGLAGPQILPAAAGKGLHPGVVVVAVGPPGGVHLPGGDAHGPQGVDREGGLLPAAAVAALVHRQGRGRPAVGGAVGGLLGAPAVHLQNGFLQGEACHPGPQFFIEQRPAGGQLLVVYPGAEHLPEKELLRQGGAPGKFRPHPQAVADTAQEQLRAVVPQVGQGQGGQEGPQQQGFLLPAGGEGRLPGFRQRLRQGGLPPGPGGLGIAGDILPSCHRRCSSSQAARTLCSSVRQISNSLRPGSPMGTPSFR